MRPAAVLSDVSAAQPDADGGHAARRPLWRRAFAGLTPRAVAIIAVLVVVRSISTTADRFFQAGSVGEFVSLSLDMVMNLTTSYIMVVTMIVVIVAASNLAPQKGPARAAALACAVVLGTLAGILARLTYSSWFVSPNWDYIRDFLAYIWPRYVLIGGLLTIVAELYRRERASTALAQQAEVDSVALERDLAAAQLQALQAQIEPHFLFNTLANVRRLYDEDRGAGRTMLEMLMRYIEVALPGMRRGESTLAREAELIEAYLHIQRVRMGTRLAFAIDIPRRLRDVTVPPMMLLTLVENAVKHGLTPSRDGGRIHVTARIERDRLVLTVADTGIGFGSGSGSGIGLANISERLASQFGDRAELVLENNALGGATASIALPIARPSLAA